MATPNQTINYGTKPPAKNLSGSKTAGAMGNPATPTVGSTPPTPSRTPMPVTPMPSTGTTPVTTGGLNSTLQKALGRQTAPAPTPMPVTVAPPPTETVAPAIEQALNTGLNTSGQYAPGYGPTEKNAHRAVNSRKTPGQKHWAATHGQGTPLYQQNMQAYQKASTDFATAVQQGRVHYDSATNQMTLDGKPYQEPTFADPSTYGGTVPTAAQAGTEFANAFDWNAATGAQRPGFDNTNLPTGITTTPKKPGQM